MDFCIISCTNRKNSQTIVLSRYIHTLIPESAFIDLSSTRLLEITDFYNDNKKIKKELNLIHQSRGVILVLPEYNGSFPGIFKYFVDHWNKDTFLNRVFYIVGLSVGRSQGFLAVRDAQNVLIHQGAVVYPQKTYVSTLGIKGDIKNFELTDVKTKRHLIQSLGQFKLFSQNTFKK